MKETSAIPESYDSIFSVLSPGFTWIHVAQRILTSRISCCEIQCNLRRGILGGFVNHVYTKALSDMNSGKCQDTWVQTFSSLCFTYEERSRRLFGSDVFTTTGECPEHSGEGWRLGGAAGGRTWRRDSAAEISNLAFAFLVKNSWISLSFQVRIFFGIL